MTWYTANSFKIIEIIAGDKWDNAFWQQKKLVQTNYSDFFGYSPYPLFRMLNNDTHQTVNLKEISLNILSAFIFPLSWSVFITVSYKLYL